MRKLIVPLVTLLGILLVPSARANQSASGWCTTGAQNVLTNGLASSNLVQASYPQCTVTVTDAVLGTIVPIFSNNSGTVLSNPFLATTIGQWQFYAVNGRYTVTLSNLVTPTGAIAPPVVIPDIILFDCTVPNACSGSTGISTVSINSVVLTSPNFINSPNFQFLAVGQNVTGVPFLFNTPYVQGGAPFPTVQAALNSLGSNPGTVIVPPGTWASNSSITVTASGQHIQCAGIESTTISYTGSGSISAVIDVGTSPTGSANQYEDSVNGCTVSGNANAVNAIRVRGTHNSDFSGNSYRNVTGAGIYSYFAVTDNFSNTRVSGDETPFVVQPTNCMYFDGPDSAHETTTASIVNPVCDSVSGSGIKFGFAEDSKVLGGTSEGNNIGAEMTPNSSGITIDRTDFEVNTTEDVLWNGLYGGSLLDITSQTAAGLININSSFMTIHGGTFKNILIQSGVGWTSIEDINYTGTLTNNGTVSTTSILNAYNGITGQFIPNQIAASTFINGSATIAGPNPWIDCTSPKYGVKGNGTTDDTAALQACFSAAIAGQTSVFLPAGLQIKLTAAGGAPVTFTNGGVQGQLDVWCGGSVNYGQASTWFQSADPILMFQIGIIGNGAASQFGGHFHNCGFRDVSVGQNTVLNAILVSDTNSSSVDHSAFSDFNRPPMATPAAPSISVGSGSTSYWVQIVCVDAAGGKTPASPETTATSGSTTLVVNPPTCSAPAVSYLVLASLTGTGTETLQSITRCSPVPTGCSLTGSWSGSVAAGNLPEAFFKYDTSAGAPIIVDGQTGGNGTPTDASYGHWDHNFFQNDQECLIFNGGLQVSVDGNEMAQCVQYAILTNRQNAQIYAHGDSIEVPGTTTTRGIILNGTAPSLVEAKFEGTGASNTTITLVEVNSSRNQINGNYLKGGVALIQQNSGSFGNTFNIHSQVGNLASPLITGATADDYIVSDTLNGGSGSQIPQPTITGHVNTFAANGDFAGILTCSSSTATKTFSVAFTSTPVIVLSDDTTAGGVKIASKSASAFTVTCTGATDVIEYTVIGNPN